jgi:hypothetical protein
MFRLTRSRRLSRRSRAVSAVIGIAAVLWMVWIAFFESSLPPREKVISALPAERLSFAQLAADEEIVVVTAPHRREPVELRFRRDGAETKVIVSALVWSETDRAWKMARVLTVRPLSESEAAGLDAVVAHLRTSGVPAASHFATYGIDYRRAESSIGREKLSASLLVMRRNEVHFFPHHEPDTRPEPEQEAGRAGVAPEEFRIWVTFEMLTPREDADEADEAR